MNGPKARSLSERMRSAVKARPRLYGALLPYVRALRHATRGGAARNLERFRAACDDVSRGVRAPFFVKVGANDGITGDPCSDLLLAGNWKGLLIEPVPYCLARLEANFSDRARFSFANVAIGSAEGEAPFYYVDERAKAALPQLPPYFDQLGSFDRQHIVKHLGGVLEPFIVERRVPVRGLSQLLAERGVGEVHLLHVDVEGFDFDVLKSLDFSRHAPVLLFIEHKHLAEADRDRMAGLLRANGYALRDCGGDYFALHEGMFGRLRAPAAAGR